MCKAEHKLERVFILTSGRTGSSLLSAILAKAGVDFGMTGNQSWDPTDGEFEHPIFSRAAHLYARAERLSGGIGKPVRPLDLMIWSATRHVARRGLAKSLALVQAVKSIHADLAIQPALKLGYRPRVILSFRKFEPQLASLYVRSHYLSVDALAAHYNRVMRNGLAAVNLFGGCVISFEGLQSMREERWAHALSAVTGIPAQTLLTSRAELARPLAPEPELPCLDTQARQLFEAAEALRGRPIRPARPFRRVLSYGGGQAGGIPAVKDDCRLAGAPHL
jgi:hypothetical protein